MTIENNKTESCPPAAEPQSNTQECGPGCACNASGLSLKHKIIICSVIGLAAVIILITGLKKKAGAGGESGQKVFAANLPDGPAKSKISGSDNNPAQKTGERPADKLWGDPLDSLASLNKIAADKNAVFIFIPATEQISDKTKKEIDAAASKIIFSGTSMAAYNLKKDSKDYSQIVKQIPAPCVLVMVKGGSMSVIKDITETNLMQGFVAASRPSSCAPSGCGPSGCQ